MSRLRDYPSNPSISEIGKPTEVVIPKMHTCKVSMIWSKTVSRNRR